ncbi:hypothetical protein [Nitrospira sp. Nam80]
MEVHAGLVIGADGLAPPLALGMLKRYAPSDKPEAIEADLEARL